MSTFFFVYNVQKLIYFFFLQNGLDFDATNWKQDLRTIKYVPYYPHQEYKPSIHLTPQPPSMVPNGPKIISIPMTWIGTYKYQKSEIEREQECKNILFFVSVLKKVFFFGITI